MKKTGPYSVGFLIGSLVALGRAVRGDSIRTAEIKLIRETHPRHAESLAGTTAGLALVAAGVGFAAGWATGSIWKHAHPTNV